MIRKRKHANSKYRKENTQIQNTEKKTRKFKIRKKHVNSRQGKETHVSYRKENLSIQDTERKFANSRKRKHVNSRHGKENM